MTAAVQAAATPVRHGELVIGLVNNMPDAALLATERQFEDLIGEAAAGARVLVRLYALAGVSRGESARAAMAGRYVPAEALARETPDALIVTGAAPRAGRLEDEPFWPAFVDLVEWAAGAGVPTLWSCLAAHAAVLRLSGIRRRRLPEKLSGVFESQTLADDPLLLAAPARWLAPHSRLHELAVADLAAHGYRILTRSREAGVDAFALGGADARFLFLQGHPEYAPETLAREYCRDLGRFLRGEQPEPPSIPRGYFNQRAEHALARLSRRGHRDRSAELADRLQSALTMSHPRWSWRATAVALFRNWIDEVAGARSLSPSGRSRAEAISIPA